MIARVRSSNNGHAKPTASVIVALYTRKSVEKGEGSVLNSTDAQREILESYVASRSAEGLVASPERYDDINYSGKNEKRPGFQRLLADVKTGRIGAIAVYMLDRLHRDSADAHQFMKLCTKLGVRIISPNESTDMATAADRLNLGVRMQVAQFQREQTAERVRDKVRVAREHGLWTGGPVPLGYVSQDGALVVHDGDAARVREIFAVFLDTGSVSATLDVLRERGVTAHGGRAFTKASLRALLASPWVAGLAPTGGEPADGVHEAIVDRESWDRAQEILARPEPRARRRPRPSGALLSGLLRCGACGAAMVEHATSKRSKGYRYYVCHRRIRESAAACPGSTVPAAELEAFVVGKIRAVGRDPAVVTEAVAAARDRLQTRGPGIARERQRLRDEKRGLLEQQERLAEAIAKGSDVAAVRRRLEKAAAALEAVSAQTATLKAEAAALKRSVIDEADLRAAVAGFDRVWDHLVRDERQRLLRLLIHRVRYDAAAGELAITYDPEGVTFLALDQEATTP